MTTPDLLPRLRSGCCGDPCRVMDTRSGCACAEAADMIERLEAELAAESPFPWSKVQHVAGTSVVHGGTLLLNAAGGAIGHVVVLSCQDEAIRPAITKALDTAGDIAKTRRCLECSRREGAEALAQVETLTALIQTLIDNDPNEPISDAGHTVLDLWRSDARKALGLPDGSRMPCHDCDGSGVIVSRVTVYDAGCGFPHDDTDERPCRTCDGTGATS